MWQLARRLPRSAPVMCGKALLADRDQRYHVERALSHHDVAVPGGHHVAHYASARGDGPRLEFLRLRIEADQGIRLHGRFAVPDDSVQEGDSIGLRSRTAGRRPLFDRTRFGIEPAEVAARIVGVIDG